MRGLTYQKFLETHPHNLNVDLEHFDLLLRLVSSKVFQGGLTDDEVVQKCIDRFGGTVTDALIDALYNN